MTASHLLTAAGVLVQALAMLMVWRLTEGSSLRWWMRLLAAYFWPVSIFVALLLDLGGAKSQ